MKHKEDMALVREAEDKDMEENAGNPTGRK
jgi:hypothetical protein